MEDPHPTPTSICPSRCRHLHLPEHHSPTPPFQPSQRQPQWWCVCGGGQDGGEQNHPPPLLPQLSFGLCQLRIEWLHSTICCTRAQLRHNTGRCGGGGPCGGGGGSGGVYLGVGGSMHEGRGCPAASRPSGCSGFNLTVISGYLDLATRWSRTRRVCGEGWVEIVGRWVAGGSCGRGMKERPVGSGWLQDQVTPKKPHLCSRAARRCPPPVLVPVPVSQLLPGDSGSTRTCCVPFIVSR